jgi:hypothetical protein
VILRMALGLMATTLALSACGNSEPGTTAASVNPPVQPAAPGDASTFTVGNTTVEAWCVNASVKDQFGNMQYLVAAHVVNVGHQYSAQVNFIQTALYDGSGAKIGDVSGLAPWANGGAVAVGPGQDVYFTEGGSTMGQAFSSCRVDDVSSNVGP